ncbi:hypothetical protein MUO69_05710 [Candidatus Bathyarchaeota archaeon]|nr:hypothetical protein [Candidatus Bathyarchaeota archaeon]
MVEIHFRKVALSAEQKGEHSRKITDVIVKEAKAVPALYTGIIHEVPEKLDG